jgi:hypothetical protein
MTALETQMYIALKSLPCRCQMLGGERWHLRAQPEVATQCSRCAAIAAYEKTDQATSDPKVANERGHDPSLAGRG